MLRQLQEELKKGASARFPFMGKRKKAAAPSLEGRKSFKRPAREARDNTPEVMAEGPHLDSGWVALGLHCTHDTLEQIECLVKDGFGRPGPAAPDERLRRTAADLMATSAFKAGMLREHCKQ